MTESERICNEIGVKFFCKDFVYQNLKYKDDKNNRIELCDGLFEYCENYIALQIKERAKESHGKKEEDWLKEIVYGKAVEQILKTINAIRERKITVKDMYQQNVDINQKYFIYPLIIFDNSKINEYKKIIDFEGIKINVFKLEDYQEMMRVLAHPYDIIYYLQERTRLLEDMNPQLVIGEYEKGSIMAKIETEKDFAMFFLNYIYEGDVKNQIAPLRLLNIIDKFRKTQIKVNADYKKLLYIFQMIEPKAALGFMERFDYAIKKANENKFDITKSMLLIKDEKRIGIIFCSIGKPPFNKAYYEVICDAKQLQHNFDIVILICFFANSNEIVLIDWIYYDKPLDFDEKAKEVFEKIGMYNGTVDRQIFEQLCAGVDTFKN